MYPISPIFADYIKRHDKRYIVKVVIDGTEYTSAQIVEFSLNHLLAGGDNFELGTAIPSDLTLKLRLPDPIRPNAKVVPYLALSLESMSWLEAEYPWESMDIPWISGATEWLPLGEFYIDTRQKINDVWTYTCFDKLITANVEYISQLSYPTTQKAVFDEICNRLGFTYDSSVVINPSYQIQAGPAGYTCRQVLAYIAGANSASIFMGKDGVMRFKRFSAGAPAVFEMTTADYIRVKQTNPLKTFTRIVVTYNTEEKLTYEAGSGDENHTLYLENPFMTQAQVNAMYVALNGLTYLPLTMDSRGFPQLDQGDVIGFEQREGGSWIDTNVSWMDMDIPWDGIQRYTSFILRQSYSFKGGLTHKIEAPSRSEQQSEYKLEGSLTQQVNKLNKENVKFDKSYYGITHSRTEGIVVEREDHKSKLTLNSDKMDWQVNGQSSLYYDAQANRLKFTGTLEGVDGKFKGIVEGGSFIGGNIQIGSSFSVNNSGHMVAVGAEFSGIISASVINGGQINGTNISAATIQGGTITGATIRTGQPGRKRLELKSDYADLEMYSGVSGNTLVFAVQDLIEDAQVFFNRDGYVYANRNLRLGSGSGSVFLQGDVIFTSGSVTGLSLSISDIAGLQSRLSALEYAINNHTHTVNIGTHNHGNKDNQNWGGTFTTSRP